MLERSSPEARVPPAKKSKPWKRLAFAWLSLPPQSVTQLQQLWALRYEQFKHRFSIGSWMINDLGRVGRGLYGPPKNFDSGRFWEGHDFSRVDKLLRFCHSSGRSCREESASRRFAGNLFSQLHWRFVIRRL